jgi:hypothetical protein
MGLHLSPSQMNSNELTQSIKFVPVKAREIFAAVFSD